MEGAHILQNEHEKEAQDHQSNRWEEITPLRRWLEGGIVPSRVAGNECDVVRMVTDKRRNSTRMVS